jgi:hypothetical protein
MSSAIRSSGLNDGVTDLDAVTGMEKFETAKAIPVVERTVGGAEILDHGLAISDTDLGMKT